MKKVLLLYYSYEGHTARIFEDLAGALHVDSCRIETAVQREDSAVRSFIFNRYNVVMKRTPELKPHSVEWQNYDAIILGTPVWVSSFAPPIRSLLESDQIKNKDIYLIYTHQGIPGKIEQNFQAAIEPANRYGGGYSVGHVNENYDQKFAELLAWLRQHLPTDEENNA